MNNSDRRIQINEHGMSDTGKDTYVPVSCVRCGESIGYVIATGHTTWLCEVCGEGKFVALQPILSDEDVLNQVEVLKSYSDVRDGTRQVMEWAIERAVTDLIHEFGVSKGYSDSGAEDMIRDWAAKRGIDLEVA